MHYSVKKGVFTDALRESTIANMTRILTSFVLAFLVLSLVRCAPETTPTQPRQSSWQGDIMDISTWDLGAEEIDGIATSPYTPNQSENQYAIVVATFTGDQHAQSAKVTRNRLSGQYPAIGSRLAFRPRSRGSVLTYGNYRGYDDPQAKVDIAMLRSIPTQQGTPLFAQVMLMKFKASRLRQHLHPYDLWTVRREFPTMVPIFTLEVAIWGDFDSGEFPQARRRAVAEGYANELRNKGFEAFFYHNDEAEMSSVTVGLFGHNAVDAETGFYSPEVDAMLSRFPVRLVNGEEVLVFFDPANPSLGSNIQPPCLAEVPVD